MSSGIHMNAIIPAEYCIELQGYLLRIHRGCVFESSEKLSLKILSGRRKKRRRRSFMVALVDTVECELRRAPDKAVGCSGADGWVTGNRTVGCWK